MAVIDALKGIPPATSLRLATPDFPQGHAGHILRQPTRRLSWNPVVRAPGPFVPLAALPLQSPGPLCSAPRQVILHLAPWAGFIVGRTAAWPGKVEAYQNGPGLRRTPNLEQRARADHPGDPGDGGRHRRPQPSLSDAAVAENLRPQGVGRQAVGAHAGPDRVTAQCGAGFGRLREPRAW